MLKQYVQYFSRQSKRLQYISAGLVILVVASIGTILLIGSRAATPYVSIDARSGSLSNGASVQQDPTAFGGSDVKFGGNASNFVQRSGTTLTLNGAPYKFVAMNIYNANAIYGGMSENCGPTMSTLSSNPVGDALDQNLTQMDSTGKAADVMRAWFFESLATDKNGAINWTPFDNTLAIAKSHGLRVMVTLDNQWSGQCVKSSYKDISWYQSGYKSTDGDGPLSYRSYVQQVVTRYANNPTILMWQFMNEAQAGGAGGGTCTETAATTAMRAWADDIGGLVKGIDPNHLTNIGTGGMGGGCGTRGSDYKTVYASPYVDVCEYHDYNYQTTSMPPPLISVLDYCGKQGLNKPMVVGETGMQVCDAGVGSYQARADLIGNKMQAQFNYSDSSGGTGVVGEGVWSWDSHPSSLCSYYIGAIDSSGTLDPIITTMVNEIKNGYK